MVSNRRFKSFDINDSNNSDWFPTPTWATEALLEQEKFSNFHTFLEPCCGDGAISKVLEEHGYNVTSSDKYDRGYGTIRDAFDIEESYDVIVTNPPFALAEELFHHFKHNFNFKLCFLLRLAFLEGANRYETIFRDNPPNFVHVFSERLSMYPAGQQGVKGGGTTSYAWFVWDAFGDERTEILWIPPGLKPNSRRNK